LFLSSSSFFLSRSSFLDLSCSYFWMWWSTVWLSFCDCS
jgi:hypothetical protein